MLGLFLEVGDGTAVRVDAEASLDRFGHEAKRRMAMAILEAIRSETPAGRVLVESLATFLAARLAEDLPIDPCAGRRPSERRSRLDEARLRRVLDYIAVHLEDDIGLEDLASAACLSPFHFARVFRSRMGMPPHRYLARRRIEHAKTLLSTGRGSLSEVALSCRFSSQASFTRAFRRSVGLTPGQYRTASSLGREADPHRRPGQVAGGSPVVPASKSMVSISGPAEVVVNGSFVSPLVESFGDRSARRSATPSPSAKARSWST